VLWLNCGDLLARVYLTFSERSGSRVNLTHTTTLVVYHKSVTSVYVERRIDSWVVHTRLLIVGTKFEYIGSICYVKILVYEHW
jgi:hypothetical protein